MRVAIPVVLALLSGSGVRPPSPASAQAVPPSYSRALELLEAGDTSAAAGELRSAVRREPDFVPALVELGALLNARATRHVDEIEIRTEAEAHLERAARLAPRDPRALLEYGVVLWKQGVGTDARRILDRALAAAAHGDEPPAPELLTRIHFHLAKVHGRWWEDWERLRVMGIPVEELKHEERDLMLEHFRLALEADPGNAEAASDLLGHLADLGRWPAYLERARSLAENDPEDHRGWLYLGVGLHEQGRETEAAAAFQAAVDRMPPHLRSAFEDVALLLPEELRERYRRAKPERREEIEGVFFRANDPLFLTPSNERRLEHLARVAWAELEFAAPRLGLHGWETPRGEIWIRYGRPRVRFQEGYGNAPGLGGARNVTADAASRRERWSYGPGGPSFSFSRNLMTRSARYAASSALLSEELAADRPELYRPRAISDLHPVPFQLARFRGSIPSAVRVEIHGLAPAAELAAEPGSRLETGVFVFGPGWRPLWDRKRLVEVAGSSVPVSYAFEVAGGRYLYGLEARLAGSEGVPRPVARARGRVDVPGFRSGELSVSDLLLACTIVPRTEGAVTERDQLEIEPSRTLEFLPDEPLHAYFEVYGLTPDEEGLGGYSATFTVRSAREPGLLTGILALVPGVSVGEPEGARVSWERTVEVRGDRVPDFFSFRVPGVPAGEYVASLRVTDGTSGRSRTVERRFSVVSSAADPE